jgi:hypothetical protein
MNTVKVKREDLLTKVRANRDAHRELFLKAQANYRKFIIQELDRMLADAKAGRKIRRSIDLVQPRDHTGDYDRTIMMLEMSVDDTIILDATEFDQYVRDVWAWTQYDGVTLGEYAVGTPVYRKPKRDWDDEEEREF